MKKSFFRIILPFVLFIAFSGLCYNHCFAWNKQAEQHIIKGNESYKKGKYLKAIDEYKAATNIEPGNLLAWESLGWAYWREGRVKDAFNIWDNLLALRPDNIAVLNRIASIYGNVYEYDRSIALYEKSLSLKPLQKETLVGMAEVYRRMGYYQDAYKRIMAVKNGFAEEERILLLLAKILERLPRYEEAARVWADLSRIRPESLEYRFNIANNQFRAGFYKEAAATAKQILRRDPNHPGAIRILAEEAIIRKDFRRAHSMFTLLLKHDSQDTEILNRLSYVAGRSKDYDTVIESSTQSLKINPLQYSASMKRADAYLDKGEYDKAIEDYEFILSRNPNNKEAKKGLFWVYVNRRAYPEAIGMLKSIRSTYPPGDPDLDILAALVNMYSDNYPEAIEILEGLRASLEKSTVTSLLYHDMSENPDDPECCYVKDFREHMKMLKEEGYHPITIHDIISHQRGYESLPPKPLLITFDDAKRNSFFYADPILEEFGFTATMFVPIAYVYRNPEAFMTFNEMRVVFDSGRWDFQAHGDHGHEVITIDASGRKGGFLVNKKWLHNKKRIETDKEFYERLREDYKQSKEILEREIPGTAVIGYAFPRGNYGQENFSNYPDSIKVNLELLRTFFRFGFYQSVYGQSLLGDDYMLIQRYTVEPGVKVEELQKHLHDYDILHRTALLLAKFYIWTGEFAKAEELLAQIPDKERGSEYYIVMSMFRKGKGQPAQAKRELETALELDKDSEKAKKDLANISMFLNPAIDPRFSHFRDNNSRVITKYSLHLFNYFTEYVDLELACEKARFENKDWMNFVDEDQFFAELAFYSLWKRGFSATAKFRTFSNDDEIFAYKLMAATPFRTWLSARLSFEHDYVDTASGILNQIEYNAAKLRLEAELTDIIWASFRYEHARYHAWHEANNRKDYVIFLIMRRFRRLPHEIFWGYGYRWGNSKLDTLAYYTPIDLSVHEIHFKAIILKDKLVFEPHCSVGIGSEFETSGVTYTVTAIIKYKAGERVDLFAEPIFDRTPTYRSGEITLGLKYSF